MSDANALNPFATRFTRPGAVEYLFPAGESIDFLLERLCANQWRGEIVGPHGAGKSTLLATLATHLAEAGREVLLATLQTGMKTLPPSLAAWPNWSPKTQVIVDGYEQLSWWSCQRLQWHVKRRGAGLLVTSHVPTGLPLLCNVAPRIEAAQAVVGKLLPNGDIISPAEVEAAFRDCDGNIREMLFQLYDLFETRTRSSQL